MHPWSRSGSRRETSTRAMTSPSKKGEIWFESATACTLPSCGNQAAGNENVQLTIAFEFPNSVGLSRRGIVQTSFVSLIVAKVEDVESDRATTSVEALRSSGVIRSP